MRRIPNEVIDDIRNKSDIVETISTYIPLTKRGKNYLGLCPFHDDNNPSLTVSSEKQIYKCFVCNAGGNVFTFIQDFEKTSFIEAVIKQAKSINYDISTYDTMSFKKVNVEKERLYELMRDAVQFTNYQLFTKEGNEAREFLYKRGYHDDLLKEFEVGVALGQNQVTKFLKAKGYKDEELLKTDMARMSDMGVQDVFYDRVIFPIKNVNGQTIAFSGRALYDHNKVKYINTSETDLYTKGNHVYNLDKVKKIRRVVDYIVITEGVTDVFAFHMANEPHVVSLLGVACTKEQIRLLKSSTQKLILAFDGDAAGIKATFEIGFKLHEANFNVRIWYNDTNLDPDDLYKENGEKALTQGIKDSVGWHDFLINYAIGLYGKDSFEDKKRVAEFVLKHLSHEDKLTQDHYLSEISKLTDFSIDTLRSELLVTQSKEVVAYVPRHQVPIRALSPVLQSEIEILKQMMLSKEAAFLYRDTLGFLPSDMPYEFSLLLLDLYRSHDTIQIADLLSLDINDNLKNFILEFESRLSMNIYDKQILEENIDRTRQYLIEKNIESKSKEVLSQETLDEKLSLLDELIKEKRNK